MRKKISGFSGADSTGSVSKRKRAPKRQRVYSSSSTTAKLKTRLSSVTPKVDDSTEKLLRPMGVLGHFGPAGEYGPLGRLGPLGGPNDAPSISDLISGQSAWDGLAEKLTAGGGPLSSAGPLNTPLSSETRRLLASTPATNQLDTGGVFALLGPALAYGPMGPLGPLGPLGGHGFHREGSGDYTDSTGAVRRSVTMDWGFWGSRTEELVEKYTEERAKQMVDNDTSFVVDGRVSVGEPDAYEFQAPDHEAWVAVQVVGLDAKMSFSEAMGEVAASAMPLNPFKNLLNPWSPWLPGGNDLAGPSAAHADFSKEFNDFWLRLELRDEHGQPIPRAQVLRADEHDRPDFIIVQVPPKAKLVGTVGLNSSFDGGDAPYRLVVTHSPKDWANADISGDHLQPVTP